MVGSSFAEAGGGGVVVTRTHGRGFPAKRGTLKGRSRNESRCAARPRDRDSWRGRIVGVRGGGKMMRTRSLTAWIAGLALLLALAGCQDSGGVNSGANGPGD